jgi:hypothetical protein
MKPVVVARQERNRESRRRGSTMNMCFSSLSAALNQVEDLSSLLSLTLCSYMSL